MAQSATFPATARHAEYPQNHSASAAVPLADTEYNLTSASSFSTCLLIASLCAVIWGAIAMVIVS